MSADKPDHDKYIANIAKSKLLFETAEEQLEQMSDEDTEESVSPTLGVVAAVFIGLALLLNLLLFGGVITGNAIQQDPVTKTIYVSFGAKLAKDTYMVGEPVIVQIDPVQANASIAVIKPDLSIVMLKGLTYTPDHPGWYTISVLLYIYDLSDRINLQFKAVDKT